MDIKKTWSDLIERLDEHKLGQTTLRDVLTKVLLFTALLAIVPWIFTVERSTVYTDMKIGSIATKKVVAPFNYFVLKTEDELREERQKNIQKVPYYFNYSDSLTRLLMYKTDHLLNYILQHKPAKASNDSSGILWNDELQQLKDDLEKKFGYQTTITNLSILYDILDNRENIEYLQNVLTLLKKYIHQGIIDIHISEISRPTVSIIRNGVEETVDARKLIDLPGVHKILADTLLKHFDSNQLNGLNYFLSQLVTPNLIYDKEFTENAVEAAIRSVSLTKDIVYENERIVDANERIDEEIYQKLYSLQVALAERSRKEGSWRDTAAYLGKTMLLAAILFIFGLYLYSYRKKIFHDNKKLLMIFIILLIQIVAAAIITGPLDWNPYLIPTTLLSMLLAILVDAGIGFVGTVVIALIIGGVQGSGYDIALITIVSGMAGIFAVHQIRTRNQVFKAIAFIAFAYLWVILALYAMRYTPLVEGLKAFGFYLLPNAILSPFITFMILGLFEKSFDITTDVTLLELSDLNHVLLKRLSMEAPGTFHHSMVVGNLAEAAAKAIGANSLLARVGSYYHDIGKMEKPEYFIENQMDAENRHNLLSPNMSALILASHVKHGIEMAKKYGIPKLIRDFIPEHHGTSLMSYFYNKALENKGETEVNEADFRYPGPKPQSKETGIVMLADSVEAATRTVKNPNPNKIRAFVEELVDKRFREGELDECDLTLRDLKMIVDAFMPILSGVFQHRIEYPEGEKKKTASKAKTKNEKNGQNGNSPAPA